MVSDLKTFAHKGSKIARQKKVVVGEFCLTSRIFLLSVLLSASVKRFYVSRMRDFFLTHFANILELSFSHSFYVSRFNSFSLSSYECLLFVIRLTVTFCALSNSLLLFCVMAELQTTLDCSKTLLLYVL